MKRSLSGVLGQLGESVEGFRLLMFSMSISSLVKYAALSLILVITVIIRLLPLRYGAYISEFDPYIWFYSARYITDSVMQKGLVGVFDYFTWHNPTTWYSPGSEGIPMARLYHPGVPLTGAFTYLFVRFLGFNVSLETVLIYFPVFTAVISVILIYLIGRRIGGEFLGLLSAFTLSVSPAFIVRSSLGWYDTESVGIFSMLAAIYFYVETLNPKHKLGKRYLCSFLSGVFVGLMVASWGASMYLVGMLSIFCIVASLLGYRPQYFERFHTFTMLVALLIASSAPNYGPSFLLHPVALLAYLSMIISYTVAYTDFSLKKMSVVSMFVTLVFLALVFSQLFSIIPIGMSGRYYAVINPFYKSANPLVQSVQEHVGSGFSSFFTNFSFILPFIMYGFYLTLRKMDAYKLFLVVFALPTIYLASSFSRLHILAAPFLALIGSFGMTGILSAFYVKLEEEERPKKRRHDASTYRSYILVSLLLIVLLMSYFSYTYAKRFGDNAVTIASSTLPLRQRVDDWLETLEWMRLNLPDDAVVAAWWDYGYWISVIGGKNSLADNGTMNDTRIEELAKMFLSEEEESIRIMKNLGAKYVLIFITPYVAAQSGGRPFYAFLGAGEEGKFLQMASIAGMPRSRFINMTNGHFLPAFWDTFLGRLIPYEFYSTTSGPGGGREIQIFMRREKYPMQPDGSSPLILVYDSPHKSYAEVLIYKLVETGA
ncbi:MAG: STT3 domain-containing protein [Candidatus Geothermarchaeales archaeon]